MRALLFERNAARFAAARVTASLAPGTGAGVGPLRLVDQDPPPVPGPTWRRVRPRLAGICGSDLATLAGRSSRWFEPVVSFPFVPGHEVVGDLDDGGRVVLEPVLSCGPRGIEPPCPACAAGHTGRCEQVAFGHLRPGLQTGYCADTGGGWSTSLVAHQSQLHPVPDGLSDEAAVMVEPAACAVHAALAAQRAEGEAVVVLGAGTLGLATVAALRHFTLPGTLLAGAKHPEQRRLAGDLGADMVAAPEEVRRAVRRLTRSLAVGPARGPGRLTGGADTVVDCVGSAASLTEALAVVRPRGRIVVVGMPGTTKIDLTPLWQREISLVGAYAYGVEHRQGPGGSAEPDGRGSGPAGQDSPGAGTRTFDLAFELVRVARLGRLVSARYPLERFQEAIAHAAAAGRRGGVKVVFDPTTEAPQPTPHPVRGSRARPGSGARRSIPQRSSPT
ncbi:MAG TPA: zinc-binding dehydrogenase [Acidimicrobiales bacterium]|nr:zinc-binding dehydrogenase [Acidimicrobiales bacterium]